jgi:hypothetical protein
MSTILNVMLPKLVLSPHTNKTLNKKIAYGIYTTHASVVWNPTSIANENHSNKFNHIIIYLLNTYVTILAPPTINIPNSNTTTI